MKTKQLAFIQLSGGYVALEWKLADLWVGAFFKIDREYDGAHKLEVWICLLPCLPIHIAWCFRRAQ